MPHIPHTEDGRRRVVIEGVQPSVDGGRFAAKRTFGEPVTVEMDAFCDGHDVIACVLQHRREGADAWVETVMRPLGNDRWTGSFDVPDLGRYEFRPIAWIDAFETWRRDLRKRLDAGQDVGQELLVGASLVDAAARRASGEDRVQLERWAERLRFGAKENDASAAPGEARPASRRGSSESDAGDGSGASGPRGSGRLAGTASRLRARTRRSRHAAGPEGRDAAPRDAGPGAPPAAAGGGATTRGTAPGDATAGDIVARGATAEDAIAEDAAGAYALDGELAGLMARYPDRAFATEYPRALPVEVDRSLAEFSAWYEIFPRSASPEPGRHGTFADVEALLPYVRDMGFDILYLPPIHPIGETHRKGPNNAPLAGPADPGSPWAIGSAEGGHKAIHPELGTLDDFRQLRRSAEAVGMELALDIALQCSPDHPYVREHPEWFRTRPDGSIQYAENPPKKYEDIYPFDFETEEWQALWEELASIFFHWIDLGVRVFRVDNPHTKPFPFWEWLIDRVKERHPDVIFLSEAFTRPKVMYRLAKLGFTQSYTYFAWRNGAQELRAYLEELTRPPVRDFFRPSFWPNTPDILTEHLQTGGRGAFKARLVLAATLSASYGIYGPAFELGEATPRNAGSEEYLDSEKYQIRAWDLDREDSLAEFVRRVNRIRRENPALRTTDNIHFHETSDDALLAFSKAVATTGTREEDADDGAGRMAAEPTRAESEPGGPSAHDDDLNVVLVVVNLDPHHVRSGWVSLDLEHLGIDEDAEFRVHDQLGGDRYLWRGPRNWISLDPHAAPAHVFRVQKRVRRETDFEYYL